MAVIMPVLASVLVVVFTVISGCGTCPQTPPLDRGDCSYTLTLKERVSDKEMWLGANGILADNRPFSVPGRARSKVWSSYLRALGKELPPVQNINGFTVSPTGIYVITQATTLQAFAPRTGELLWKRSSAAPAWMTSCWWTSGNELLVVEGSRLIRLSSAGDMVSSTVLPYRPNRAAYSMHADRIAIAKSGSIQVMDGTQATVLSRMAHPRIQEMSFANEGERLVSTHTSPAVLNLTKEPGCWLLWDVTDGGQIGSAPDATGGFITYILPTGDQDLLLVGSVGAPWQVLDTTVATLCTLGEETKKLAWFWFRNDGSGYALSSTGEAWSSSLDVDY